MRPCKPNNNIMKKEIKLPKGATIEIRQDKVIIEYDDVFKPKNGDFCVIDEDDKVHRTLFIYDGKTTKNDALSYQAAKIHTEFRIAPTKGLSGTPRPATEEEREELLSELHKIGKDWDAEKMEIVELKWEPKKGEMVYVASVMADEKVYPMTYSGAAHHRRLLERDLMFRTRAEAIACTDKMLNAIK